MNLLQAIILGIVQGLTEFIPVSSSGHLVLAQYFIGLERAGDLSFEIFLHLGTLCAVLIFFRHRIWELIKSMFCWGAKLDGEIHRHNRMLIVFLILSTLSTAVMYILFKDLFEAAYTCPLFVSLMLILTGILIYSSDLVKDNSIPASNMGFIKSMFIGLAQGVAILPGISRSGSTIATSLFCRIKRKDAAHYSFLLSIPAIVAANVSEYQELMTLDPAVLPQYIGGFIASFIAGYLVIALLIRLIQGGNLKYFAFYLWLVAALSISFILYR